MGEYVMSSGEWVIVAFYVGFGIGFLACWLKHGKHAK